LIAAGDRRALAQAITLVESTRSDHRVRAEALLGQLPPLARSLRLGISGVPGVGKSTFIERFGLLLIERGHRVAVLAIDPSSRRTGGSILGDKTRMHALASHPAAFIRPSAAGTTLGGVARRTADAILLTEAAGYDVVIIETVGVGQSETAVSDLTDLFLLLLPPAGGDELQGIKKGIVELADILVINKADGDLAPAARRTVADYTAALHLLRPINSHWRPPVLAASAATGAGLPEVWEAVEDWRAAAEAAGVFLQRRAAQAVARLWAEVADSLLDRLRTHPAARRQLPQIEAEIEAGRLSAVAGARLLLDAAGA
jgi:LAO/AO transport system kinase